MELSIDDISDIICNEYITQECYEKRHENNRYNRNIRRGLGKRNVQPKNELVFRARRTRLMDRARRAAGVGSPDSDDGNNGDDGNNSGDGGDGNNGGDGHQTYSDIIPLMSPSPEGDQEAGQEQEGMSVGDSQFSGFSRKYFIWKKSERKNLKFSNTARCVVSKRKLCVGTVISRFTPRKHYRSLFKIIKIKSKTKKLSKWQQNRLYKYKKFWLCPKGRNVKKYLTKCDKGNGVNHLLVSPGLLCLQTKRKSDVNAILYQTSPRTKPYFISIKAVRDIRKGEPIVLYRAN
jgi:hypothetical protein